MMDSRRPWWPFSDEEEEKLDFVFTAKALKDFIERCRYMDCRKAMEHLPMFATTVPRSSSSKVPSSNQVLPRRLQFPLLELPDELIQSIAEELLHDQLTSEAKTERQSIPNLRALGALSKTSKRIRTLTVPFLFSCLSLPLARGNANYRCQNQVVSEFPLQFVTRLMVAPRLETNVDFDCEMFSRLMAQGNFPILRNIKFTPAEAFRDSENTMWVEELARFLPSFGQTLSALDLDVFTSFSSSSSSPTIPKWVYTILNRVATTTNLRSLSLASVDEEICHIIERLTKLEALQIGVPEGLTFQPEAYVWSVKRFTLTSGSTSTPHANTCLESIAPFLSFVAGTVEKLTLSKLTFVTVRCKDTTTGFTNTVPLVVPLNRLVEVHLNEVNISWLETRRVIGRTICDIFSSVPHLKTLKVYKGYTLDFYESLVASLTTIPKDDDNGIGNGNVWDCLTTAILDNQDILGGPPVKLEGFDVENISYKRWMYTKR